jgi:hypothetical protein
VTADDDRKAGVRPAREFARHEDERAQRLEQEGDRTPVSV